MNEFDDLDQLEREFGPALRLALRRVAADIPDNASASSPAPILRVLDGEQVSDVDERDVHTMAANDLARERHPRRRWVLVAAATIVVLALGLLAVAAIEESDSVQTDTVPPTPAPSTNTATTSPLLPADSSPATLPALTAGTPVTEPDTASDTAVSEVSATTSPPTALESSAIVESNLDWTTSPIEFSFTSPNGFNGYFVAGDGPLVASTHRTAPQVSDLAVSDDGVTWRAVETSPGLAVQDADASGGTIALIGHAPSAAGDGVNPLVVMTSSDGGTHWIAIPLPAEVASHSDPYISAGTRSGDAIVVRGDVVVVSIAIGDARGTRLYVSTAGSPFDLVDIGANSEHPDAPIGLARSSTQFLAMDDAVVDPSTLWQSTDGVTWTKVGVTPVRYAYLQWKAFGRVGDLYVVAEGIIDDPQANSVWLSQNGTDWVQSDLGGFAGVGFGLEKPTSINDNGITFVGGTTDEAGSITKDGLVFVVKNEGLYNVTVYDAASGEMIVEITGADDPSAIPFVRGNEAAAGFDILDSEGNVRTTFTLDDFNAAQPEVQLVIIHSDDGIGWSSTPINDLIGVKPGLVVWNATLGTPSTIAIEEFDNTQATPFADLHVLIGTPQP